MRRLQRKMGWHVCPKTMGFNDNRRRPKVGVTSVALRDGRKATRTPRACVFGMHAATTAFYACRHYGRGRDHPYLDEVLIEGDLDFWFDTKFCGRRRTVIRRVHRRYLALAASALGIEARESGSLKHVAERVQEHCHFVLSQTKMLFNEVVELAFWLQDNA